MGIGDQLRFRCPDFPHLQLAANTNAVIFELFDMSEQLDFADEKP